jgi:hypothetical protein
MNQRSETTETPPGESRNLTLWSGSMAEADERDQAEWRNPSPQERMEALEYIRALNYGYAEEDQPRPEFQRVYQVAELRRG